MNLETRILDLLRSVRPEADFPSSQDFVGDGLLDSFDLVTLVAEIDRAFSLSVPGTDILPENFRNLAAIADLLRRLGAA